jgi:flagellin
VTTLTTALLNTSQGSSLLQVADGALNQITDILQRQKAIAVQAGSGSLTSSERSFLNQEFQNLTQEVQRLSTKTNFNGVSLLDGILTKTVDAKSVSTNASLATASMAFNTNAAAAQTVIINGVTFTASAAPVAATDFKIGTTVLDTVANLASALNASTNLSISSAKYTATGNTLNITSKVGGLAAQDFIIDARNTLSTWTSVAASNASLNGPDAGSYTNVFQVALGALDTTSSVVALATGTATQGISNTGGNGLNVQVGASGAISIYTVATGDSLNNIVDKINANTTSGTAHGITAQIVGSSGAYNIQLRHSQPDLDNAGGVVATSGDITMTGTGTFFTASRNNLGVATVATAALNTIHVQETGLGGGNTTGLGAGDTVGIGTIGNSLVNDQNQTKSVVNILFPPIAAASLSTTLVPTALTAVQIQIGDPTTSAAALPQPIELATFTFSNNTKANASSTEISIGATLEETIDNAASVINKFSGTGTNNFDLNQVRAYRSGQTLVIESLDYGSTTHLDNTVAAAAVVPVGVGLNGAFAAAGVSVTNGGNLSNGLTTGVATSNVTNKEFVGKISGFTATATGAANTVNAQVTVGDFTYTASAINTAPTANTVVRFSSTVDGGGYFDVQLRANSGTSVNSQANADTFASRLNGAFSTLSFYQTRDVSSYKGTDPVVTNGIVTGSLLGTSVRVAGTDFASVKIQSIDVAAPVGSSTNGTISFTINGESYTSQLALGSKLGSNQTYKFVSASDGNKFIQYTTGDTAIDFGTAAKAASFQKSLETAFGVGTNNATLSFQVGAKSSDSLSIGLSGVTTNDLGTTSLDVLTQTSAATSADSIDEAINKVTSVRAEVGALQSRFNFAAANVESSIANQDAARGVLLDTDIAAESTAFSTAQVQLQAGISVLAQANQLPQNLLKLIQ